ncbi:gastrokine-1-like [Gastrophryne carolinensis]
MKTLVIFAALIGTLLANDNIGIDNSGNNGGNVHQDVNINNRDNVANINTLNGWNSWNSVCDYNRGIFATRLFSRRQCVIVSIGNIEFPEPEGLGLPPMINLTPISVRYTFNNYSPIPSFDEYGEHVETLCRGIPTFTADLYKVHTHHDCDVNSIVTIGGITFCF